MSAEIVRTTRVYARCIARIKPEWVEQVGSHLRCVHAHDDHPFLPVQINLKIGNPGQVKNQPYAQCADNGPERTKEDQGPGEPPLQG